MNRPSKKTLKRHIKRLKERRSIVLEKFKELHNTIDDLMDEAVSYEEEADVLDVQIKVYKEQLNNIQ